MTTNAKDVPPGRPAASSDCNVHPDTGFSMVTLDLKNPESGARSEGQWQMKAIVEKAIFALACAAGIGLAIVQYVEMFSPTPQDCVAGSIANVLTDCRE
jgi:hypothetical protein